MLRPHTPEKKKPNIHQKAYLVSPLSHDQELDETIFSKLEYQISPLSILGNPKIPHNSQRDYRSFMESYKKVEFFFIFKLLMDTFPS